MASGDDPAGMGTTAPLSAEDEQRARARARGRGRLFDRDELVAGRYKIVRFLAEGGMGEVYEALDQELRERVALKSVRSDRAHRDGLAIERFKREIALARKVTHPNVCRIFDMGIHRDGDEEIPFLTMELLSGETVLARVRRVGRLSVDEARPIVAQMAAALHAAHRVGIVHRDFKSENVFLVPDGAAVRAVVTDFGLARAVAGDRSAAWITGSAGIVGSPAYMAPEQVEGGEVGVATDLYALGVVIYEMTTGTLPFLADSPLATAAKRLKEDPPPPRSRAPSLPASWDDVILSCLEREPSRRPASADDVVRLLDGLEPRGESTTSGAGGSGRVQGSVAALPTIDLVRPKRKRFLLAIAAATLAIAAAAVAWRSVRPSETTPSERRSVAILGFRNLGGDADAAWLSTALGELVTAEVSAGEALRTIPAETVARAKLDLSLPESDSYAAETLARLRAMIDADYLVLGSYLAKSGKLRVDVRVQDLVSGEVIANVIETDEEARVIDLVARAGTRLRSRLGLGAADASATSDSLPRDREAARLYAEGLARLRVLDGLGARERLERAARLEPNHPLVHAALADAWRRLGHQAQARSEARRAFELSSGLRREDRLLVEARLRETEGAWARAAELHHTLFVFYPDDVEHGLRLAHAQVRTANGREALVTAARLRRFGDDPRIDLVEANAAMSVSDFALAERAAERAVERARELGARLFVGEARLLQAWARRSLGKMDAAVEAGEEARRIFEEAGDRSGVAHSLDILGGLTLDLGRVDRALEMRERALAIADELGHRGLSAVLLGNISTMHLVRGDAIKARELAEQALAIGRELGNTSEIPWALIRLGAARYLAGELAEAQAAHEEALGLARASGEGRSIALALFRLGEALFVRGDLVGARTAHEEAFALRERLGLAWYLPYSRQTLAELELEEGRLDRAASHARIAADGFHDLGRADHEAEALAVLARIHHARGDREAALDGAARAERLVVGIQHAEIRVLVPVRLAPIRKDVAAIDRAIAEAEAHGMNAHAAEARRERLTIELGRGARGARDALARLAADAEARGFGLTARRARATLAALGSPEGIGR